MADYCSPFNDNVDDYLCGMRQGGLKGTIYAANFGDISGFTSSTSDKEYDSVIMKTNPITAQAYYWYQIQFRKNSAGLNNEMVIGTNKYVNQSITFQVNGLTKQSHQVLQDMAEGEASFIAVDYQGVVHLLGRVAGLEVSAASSGTGTALDDFYGATLSFTGAEPEFSNFIKSGTSISVFDGISGTTTVTF